VLFVPNGTARALRSAGKNRQNQTMQEQSPRTKVDNVPTWKKNSLCMEQCD